MRNCKKGLISCRDFFVEPHQIDEAAHQIHIIGTDVNHISNVLRMKQGEEVWISDGGQKEYRCVDRGIQCR